VAQKSSEILTWFWGYMEEGTGFGWTQLAPFCPSPTIYEKQQDHKTLKLL